MKIYVGNVAYDVTEQELRQEFAAFGEVSSVSIITDRDSGRSRGFAFAEMPSTSEGQAAISALNGKMLKERTLSVSPARPPGDNRGGGRSSYGNRGGGYNSARGGRSGGGRQRRY